MPQTFQPENVTVAITGASGSVFAVHLLRALEADKRVKAVNLIVSDTALRVLAEEVGIRGRSDLPFDKMMELDLEYVRNWSLVLDLEILLETPLAVLSGRGAY